MLFLLFLFIFLCLQLLSVGPYWFSWPDWLCSLFYEFPAFTNRSFATNRVQNWSSLYGRKETALLKNFQQLKGNNGQCPICSSHCLPLLLNEKAPPTADSSTINETRISLSSTPNFTRSRILQEQYVKIHSKDFEFLASQTLLIAKTMNKIYEKLDPLLQFL